MMNKITYSNEVNIRFNVYTTNNKIVDKIVEKIAKLLNKADIGTDIHINRTFEIYPDNSFKLEDIEESIDEKDLCDEDLLNELED